MNCDLEVEAKRNPCTLSCLGSGCFITVAERQTSTMGESLKCIWGWEATLQRGHVCLAPISPPSHSVISSSLQGKGSALPYASTRLSFVTKSLRNCRDGLASWAADTPSPVQASLSSLPGDYSHWHSRKVPWSIHSLGEASTDKCQVLGEEPWGGKWTE